MAQTIEELERDQEHAAALAELKRQRGEAAAKVAKLDEKIETLGATDFRERVGPLKTSEMTVPERVELVNKVGAKRFGEMVIAGRR